MSIAGATSDVAMAEGVSAMAQRRLVTGKRDGKSVVLSDGPVPTEHRYEAVPGMSSAIVWTTAANPAVDVDEAAPVGTPIIVNQ